MKKTNVKNLSIVFDLFVMYICMAIVLILMIIMAILACFGYGGIHNEVKDKIDKGYIVYVNGTEVDPDKIEIDKYSPRAFSIDDNNDMILITVE